MKRSSFARKPPERKALPFPSPIKGGIAEKVGDGVAARPKTEPKRNRALLDMARDKPCLLRVPGICIQGAERLGLASTTVACHSNLSRHGKAWARKADDFYTVWGCVACHEWLDRGPASHDVKEEFFLRAHSGQIGVWRWIAERTTGKDQRAAQWALDQLSAAGE